MSLCPKTLMKQLMNMEVTEEGQMVPSALAEPGRTWGAAVWLLLRCENKPFSGLLAENKGK